MNPKNSDIDTLLFCAFRYALGRKTYITSDVADLIIKYKHSLRVQTALLMQREILEAIDSDGAGMRCDIASWERVLENL